VLVRRSCSSSRSLCRRLPPTPSRSKGRGEAPPNACVLPAVLEAVDRRDIRMIQGGEHLRFSPETSESIGIGRERVREDLQRDVAIELRIAGAVDLAHATRADLRDDLEWAETSARG